MYLTDGDFVPQASVNDDVNEFRGRECECWYTSIFTSIMLAEWVKCFSSRYHCWRWHWVGGSRCQHIIRSEGFCERPERTRRPHYICLPQSGWLSSVPSSAIWWINVCSWKHRITCSGRTKKPQLGLFFEELAVMVTIMYARGTFCAKGITEWSLVTLLGLRVHQMHNTKGQILEASKIPPFWWDPPELNACQLTSLLLSLKFGNSLPVAFIVDPRENITVDERLLPSTTWCGFIQFMASSPDKYEVKF